MSTAFAEQFSTARPEGPAWLSPIRERAMAAFQSAGFPTTKNEDWHFTNPSPIAEATFVPMGDGTWRASKWLVSSQWGWRLADIPMELPPPYLYEPPSVGSHHGGMQPR